VRRFFTPGWLGLHALAITLFAAFLAFGWWQFDRAQAGNDRSWAYVFEWPIFAIFVIVMWIKMMRDELDDDPDAPGRAPKVIEEPAEAAVTRAIIRRQEEEDPQLAAYNRYLARLNSETHRRD
jgi:DNA-binding transcriptional regulator of glucitol operon